MKKFINYITTLICCLILLGFSISLFAVVRENPDLDNNPVVIGIGLVMAYLAYLAIHKIFGGKDEK